MVSILGSVHVEAILCDKVAGKKPGDSLGYFTCTSVGLNIFHLLWEFAGTATIQRNMWSADTPSTGHCSSGPVHRFQGNFQRLVCKSLHGKFSERWYIQPEHAYLRKQEAWEEHASATEPTNLFQQNIAADFNFQFSFPVKLDLVSLETSLKCATFLWPSVCPVHPDWSPLPVSDFPLAWEMLLS